MFTELSQKPSFSADLILSAERVTVDEIMVDNKT